MCSIKLARLYSWFLSKNSTVRLKIKWWHFVCKSRWCNVRLQRDFLLFENGFYDFFCDLIAILIDEWIAEILTPSCLLLHGFWFDFHGGLPPWSNLLLDADLLLILWFALIAWWLLFLCHLLPCYSHCVLFKLRFAFLVLLMASLLSHYLFVQWLDSYIAQILFLFFFFFFEAGLHDLLPCRTQVWLSYTPRQMILLYLSLESLDILSTTIDFSRLI